jgi:hypothetical protein
LQQALGFIRSLETIIGFQVVLGWLFAARLLTIYSIVGSKNRTDPYISSIFV